MTGIRIPLYIQVCHIVYRGSTVFKIYCHSDTFLNEHIKVIPTSPFPHIPLYWGAFRYLYVLSGISVAFRYFGCFPVFDRTPGNKHFVCSLSGFSINVADVLICIFRDQLGKFGTRIRYQNFNVITWVLPSLRFS